MPYYGCNFLPRSSQPTRSIEFADITNFWNAFDALKLAKTKSDSVEIIQREYIDVSTKSFKKFVEKRNFTAHEYISIIQAYSKFWASIRPLTLDIKNRLSEIEEVFAKYEAVLPNFNRPKICFAIGCLRTGGTTSGDLVLIGSEIAAANNHVDKSEMYGWLWNVVGNTGDIVSMIAHEIIHTQQYDNRLISGRDNILLEQTMKEGVADFFTLEFLSRNINAKVFEYGKENECSLIYEFLNDLENHPNDYKRWIYQGNSEIGRPADLGYYIGYKIAKLYYDSSNNKYKAIKDLLNVKNYQKIFKESKLIEYNCE